MNDYPVYLKDFARNGFKNHWQSVLLMESEVNAAANSETHRNPDAHAF